MSIKLGSKVTDCITGFTGIAYERSEFLVGATMIGILPKVEDNKASSISYFVEERLMAERVSELAELKNGKL